MTKFVRQKNIIDFFFKASVSKVLLVLYVLFVLCCLVAGFGKLLNYVFPLGAFIIGLLLYCSVSTAYIEFVWWLWFLSPLIRRLADYQSGFTDPSPILLAPYFATIICSLSLLKKIPKIRDGIPFLLAFSSIVYGAAIGYLNSANKISLIIAFLDYSAPVLFGYYIFLGWKDCAGSYQKVFQSVFSKCILLTGAYGIYQYFVAPPWDSAWLVNIGLVSMGKPEPFGIRVWSTMHSPGVFSQVMASGLVFVIALRQNSLTFPMNIVGYLSLLLSLVRSAWLGWIVGMSVLLVSLNTKFQLRLIAIGTLLGLAIVGLIVFQSYGDSVVERLMTLQDPSSDRSASVRSSIYQRALEIHLFNIVGDGLARNEGFDSGLLTILADLGWIGAIPYLGSILVLFAKSLRFLERHSDVFSKACFSASIACFSQIGFGYIHIELPGMLLWSFLGLSLAAQKAFRPRLEIEVRSYDLLEATHVY